MSETVIIETTKNFIKFSVSGENIGGNIRLESNVSGNVDEAVDINVVEPVNLAFALRYLNMFTKATPLSDTVTLHLSSEYPLMAEYKLSDKLGHIRFFLAPRINEENS